MTHNTSWGFHAGDRRFKPLWNVVDMLVRAAAGAGNLLLNIGPDGSGVVPEASVTMFRGLGAWLETYGEGIFGTEPFTFDWRSRDNHRADWISHGRYTARGHTLYVHLLKWPGTELTLAGLENIRAKSARLLGEDAALSYSQHDDRLQIRGLPAQSPHPAGSSIAIEFDGPPNLYLCGGMRLAQRCGAFATNQPWRVRTTGHY